MHSGRPHDGIRTCKGRLHQPAAASSQNAERNSRAAIHDESPSRKPPGLEKLSSARSIAPAPLHWLDYHGEARRNPTTPLAGSDPPAGEKREAWIEVAPSHRLKMKKVVPINV